MTFNLTRIPLTLACVLSLAMVASAQNTGSIRGQVTDPSGASIPGATIVASGNGPTRNAKSDNAGRYTITGLASGKFNIRGDAKGFVTFLAKDVNVGTGQAATLDIAMLIATEAQEVQVSDNSQTAVSVDPSQNVGAIVLKAEDLDALPDDPDDLQSDLQALAGPAAGPNGAQFFIDGFSGGQLPPKSSIREIRINSNPFSAEFDRPGFGRVEIFTKPGTDRFHGGANFNFGDKVFNSRNPLLGPTDATPDFISEFYGANFGGPITKKSSFFIDFNKRNIDDNALIRPFDPATNFTQQLGLGIVTPNRFTTISPRIDYAINSSNTLVVRYHWTESTNQNAGLGTYSFLTQAENTATHNNTVQATETSVLGTKAVNETRFQFNEQRSNQNGSGVGGPTISIASVAIFGGAPILANYTHIRAFELQNLTTMTQGTHAIKFGFRARDSNQDQNSTSNFNGSYFFPSIAAYDSGQPLQFSLNAGTPLLNVKQFDIGLFVQDDWRVRPNLTVSLGARYEVQTNVSDKTDIAPRIGIAWAPFAKGTKPSKTVVRLGYGFFFDRVDDNLTLNTYRYNGASTLNYLLKSTPDMPIAFSIQNPTVPSLTSLASARASQAIYKLDANIKAPETQQLALGFDQQLPYKMTLTVNYVNSRGVHIQRTRNINAPYPQTYNPVTGTAVRPYGDIGDLYLYEDSGIFKQQQVITQLNARVNRSIQLSGFYALGYAHSNVNGFPSNQYDTSIDYGRSNFDVRNRAGIFGNLGLPFAFSLAPIITINSGAPYNVTVGNDLNGDGQLNDRPAFATSTSTNVKVTKFGTFDLSPAYGTKLIPVNYLEGPGQINVNLRLSRTFGWGERSGANPNAGMGGGPGGDGGGGPRGGGGGGGGGGRGGGGMPGGMGGMMGGMGRMGGGGTGKRYNLTATLEARNAINHVNYGSPIGNLLSPNFGTSQTLAGGFGGGPGGGGNSAAGNRRLSLQLRFTF